MKCLVLSDGALYRTGPGAEVYRTRNTFFRFLEELAGFFDSVTLLAPVAVARDRKALDGCQELRATKKLRILSAGNYDSVASFYLGLWRRAQKNRRLLASLLKNHHVALLRLPCTNTFVFAGAIERSGIPAVSFLVGDQEAIVRSGGKYGGRSGVAARALAVWHTARMKRLIRHSERTVFLGRELKEKLGTGAPGEEVLFTSLVTEADILRRRQGAGFHDPVRLVSASRLTHEKGLDFLLKTAALLTEQGTSVKLDVCGEGPEKAGLQRLARDLGIEDLVRFLGYTPLRPDLLDRFSESDVFVLPSLSEGVPKVLLEAMARELPVVATDVGGVAEIVRHDETGLLARPRSPSDLAHAVLRLMREPGLADRLRNEATGLVEKHTLKQQAARLAEILWDAAAEKASRTR